ncbi:MAG: hypothetical protein OZSIB_1804 [Candidatus Ozemobacter sibiricus]|jgi:hypothetical protein|uniref:Uncharacterized protein n=1 Tax=Candidatus Ozemobacter sibiricus TaxID=2268124 RepID=A0A367ZJ63_9BACT|nr:MAG: hypothetical protein OZSIB_1804 [Candidatus Ozemobacter sibiricus]
MLATGRQRCSIGDLKLGSDVLGRPAEPAAFGKETDHVRRYRSKRPG